MKRLGLIVCLLGVGLAHADERGAKTGVFKDCADCPEMIVVPAGSFDMGSTRGDADEKPVHRVKLAGFALGKTEVTQGQWRAAMGNNPSHFSSCGDDCSVENVSWEDAQAFVKKLSEKTGKPYRLPSEAEWEYACRAGGKHQYCGGNALDALAWYGAHANGKGNSKASTHPVAGKRANAWGFHDMSGNVWEWVEDCWQGNYSGAPADGSARQGEGQCSLRVQRGGSWGFPAISARASDRARAKPTLHIIDLGFRVARPLP